MTRTRMILLGFFALVLSAVVTYFIQRELSSRLDLEPVQPDEIVVAKVPLQIGMMLEEKHLKTAPWPKESPVEGSVSNPADIIGRGVLFPIQVNEPILESKLARAGSGAGLAPAIPEGMRALAVPVNNVVGVAGFVLPGSRVDVILSGSPDGSRIDFSRAILENIQVLSAGQEIAYDAEGKPKSVPVVTLLLDPEQSQTLTLAMIDGRIQLALRNPLDQEAADPNPVRREALYAASSHKPALQPEAPVRRQVTRRAAPPRPPVAAVAPPPAPRTFEVELIEGTDRKNFKFKEKEGTPDQPPDHKKEGSSEQ